MVTYIDTSIVQVLHYTRESSCLLCFNKNCEGSHRYVSCIMQKTKKNYLKMTVKNPIFIIELFCIVAFVFIKNVYGCTEQ